MSEQPSVMTMLQVYLRANGYDGLYNADLECGCGGLDLNGLCPCSEPDVWECRAAVKKIAGPDHEYPGEEIYGPREDE